MADLALANMDPALAEAYRLAVGRSSPRPSEWTDIIGNARAVEQIREAITAAKKMARPLPHLLLFGPPGTGKSTLAKIVSRECGGDFFETTASTLETPQDMIRFLLQMIYARERTGQPSTLFIDECVDGDALIATNRGCVTLRHIATSSDQFKVLSWCGTHFEYRSVTNRWRKGVKPVVRVTCSDGGTVRTTTDHAFLTQRGWIPADSLTRNDFVLVAAARGLSRESTSRGLRSLPDTTKARSLKSTSTSPSWPVYSVHSWAMAVSPIRTSMPGHREFHSTTDPNRTPGYNTRYANLHPYDSRYLAMQMAATAKKPLAQSPLAIQPSVKSLIWSERPADPKDASLHGNELQLSGSPFSMTSLLRGGSRMTGAAAITQSCIPKAIQSTTSPSQHAFCAAEVTQSRSTSTPTSILSSDSTAFQHDASTKPYDAIPPNACSTNFALQNYAIMAMSDAPADVSRPRWPKIAADAIFVSVASVTPDGVAEVFDLEVDGSHNFVANGIVVHNCHMLGVAKGRQAIDQESIFPLLEDWRFPHNLIRKVVTDVNGIERIMTTTDMLVWPFSCIGATTEPGMLSQPLLRRFLIQIELEPYTEAEITQIIMGSARRLEWRITESAAETLAKFGRRTPGTALALLTSANSRAVATSRETIDDTVADEVIERMRLYPLGLTETDVRVLRLLYDRIPKGVGMAEISRALNISVSQFGGMIEPFLRSLNFMETLSRRCIRPEGIRYLAQIGKIADVSRPEVRAALT